MRIRTIKPDFWTDAVIVQLPPLARLLFIGMWNVADDHGYLTSNPDQIQMLVMPREKIEDVSQFLSLLISIGLIEEYISDDTKYLKIKNWTKHQRVDKPSASKFYKENSKKVAISNETRRDVAIKYGCKPGEELSASCFYCGNIGTIKWWKTSTGKISSWVSFNDLQLDHVDAESKGGEGTASNIVLACEHCNKSKGANDFTVFIGSNSRGLQEPYGSTTGGKGREGKGMEIEATTVVPEKQGTEIDSFNKFYNAYPKKQSRGAAERAYKTALKETNSETILAGAFRYAASRKGEDPKFTKMPATWLNQKCWDDEESKEPGDMVIRPTAAEVDALFARDGH